MQTVDLRSDTVSKPSQMQLQFMLNAEVGDDCYGDDPSVNALQRYAAELFGKEAALFNASGTMSNQIAARVHLRAGDELITEENYHINFYEGGATAGGAGVVLNTIATQDGILTPQMIDVAIAKKPRGPLYAKPKLLWLENTMANYGGSIMDEGAMYALRQHANERKMAVHLDGARLLHACVATGVSPATYAQYADTVSICCAKTLGPFGSLLLGSQDQINEAKIHRKRMGGGLHQAGYMAAAAMYGLQNYEEIISQDHKLTQSLHRQLKDCPHLAVPDRAPATNMLYFDVAQTGLTPQVFVKGMEERGVKLFPWVGSTVRAMPHKNLSMDDIRVAADEIKAFAYEHQLAQRQVAALDIQPKAAFALG
jgi:threonine aldolase